MALPEKRGVPAARGITVPLRRVSADDRFLSSVDGIEAREISGKIRVDFSPSHILPSFPILFQTISALVRRASRGKPGRGRSGANATDLRDDENFVRAMNSNIAIVDNRPITAPSSSTAQAVPKAKNILIVDDSPDTLRLLEFLMADEGHVVQTADGAESALALLYSFTPDVVLMDIRLPGMDGLELTRLIKLARGAKNVPVVAVSAGDTAVAIEKAYEAGCDGYITKPVDTRTFAENVRQYLDLT
jgi:two-component system cell cycle response regulator DivK